MSNQSAQKNPLDQVSTDDASIVDLVNRIKSQIMALNEESTTSLYMYEAMLTIIKLHAALAESTLDLTSVYETFQIGSEARTIGALLNNIDNLIRRAACLSEIEERFFTKIVQTPEGDMPECLLSWGDEPEEYAERFGTALESRKESSPIILLN